MKLTRQLTLLLALPAFVLAQEVRLKIDKTRSFIDVDVKATVDSFIGRLEGYETVIPLDATGKIKIAQISFKFTNLKTGKTDRDAKMLEWLGGGVPEGKFELGTLALAPDGQGVANGNLTFHGVTQRIEFPVQITKADDTTTIAGEATIDYRNWNLKVIRLMMALKVDPIVKVKFKLIGSPAEMPPGFK
jgi:polyisoprenoid-binding protein YceI